MTDYEMALIRLRAFKLLDGWGTTIVEKRTFGKSQEKFVPNTLERRMELASDLADWAMEDDGSDGDDGDREDNADESRTTLRVVGKKSASSAA